MAMILLAALCAAGAAFVTIYTLVTPGRARAMATRLDQFERTAEPMGQQERLAQPFAARILMPILSWWRRALGGLLPASVLRALEHRLVVAGEPVSLHGFVALEVMALGGGALLLVSGLIAGGDRTFFGAILLAVLILGAAPLYWLRIKIAARKRAILKALPDAVDLVVTTVEAGMSIDAALAEVGQEVHGPLGEELRLAVRETTLGRSRRDALERLNDRTEVPELRSFIQSLIQAETTGIPVGQVLRTQAAQLRIRRRQRAEAEAQRAPIKMVMVLVLFTLPTLMLVVMGPAFLRLSEDNIF
jgi:tight adherence protein C